MACRVEFTKRGKKEFDRLPKEIQGRVAPEIDNLPEFSLSDSNIKKLKEPLGGYSKRVGDYRVLFVVEKNAIAVHSVRHRKDAYK